MGVRKGLAVFEGSLSLRLAPEDFVIPIRIERQIDIDSINTDRRPWRSEHNEARKSPYAKPVK